MYSYLTHNYQDIGVIILMLQVKKEGREGRTLGSINAREGKKEERKGGRKREREKRWGRWI